MASDGCAAISIVSVLKEELYKMKSVLSLLFLLSIMMYGHAGMKTVVAERGREAEIQQSNFSSPEMTLGSFIAALNRADLKGAAAFVEGGRVANAADWFEDMMRQDRWTYTATDYRTKIEGTSAVVQVRTNLSCDTRIGPQVPLANEEILKLRRVGMEWKIVPEEETAKNVPGYGMVQRAAMMLARDESGQHASRKPD
jgi:hypothetical protein